MKNEWFVMYNPVKGYIAARKVDGSSEIPDSLEFRGKYSDDKTLVQKLVDILNEDTTNDENEKTEKSANDVKIDVSKIPEADFELGCTILDSSIRRFFEQPGVQEEYKEWLKSEEAKRFRD